MTFKEVANLVVQTITRQYVTPLVVVFDANGAPLQERDIVTHVDTPDVTGKIVAIEDRDTLWNASIYSFSDFKAAKVTEVVAVWWSDTGVVTFHGSHLLELVS